MRRHAYWKCHLLLLAGLIAAATVRASPAKAITATVTHTRTHTPTFAGGPTWTATPTPTPTCVPIPTSVIEILALDVSPRQVDLGGMVNVHVVARVVGAAGGKYHYTVRTDPAWFSGRTADGSTAISAADDEVDLVLTALKEGSVWADVHIQAQAETGCLDRSYVNLAPIFTISSPFNILIGPTPTVPPHATFSQSPTASSTPTAPDVTPTPTCAPTGTPYCADDCIPCPTVRPSCYSQACGACVHYFTSCAEGESRADCRPLSYPDCLNCGCVTNTPDRSPTPTPTATMADLASPTPGCEGDCNSDYEVTVDEILLGIDIALGNRATDICTSLDFTGDGSVTVEELQRAITHALSGCALEPDLRPPMRGIERLLETDDWRHQF